jgi:hypothetical protein
MPATCCVQPNYKDLSNVDDVHQSLLLLETQQRLKPWADKVPEFSSACGC